MDERLEGVDSCPAPADVLLACEGELPSAQTECVLAHVRHCKDCQEHVRSLETLCAGVSDSLPDDRVLWVGQRVFNQRLQAPTHARAVRWRAGRRAMMAAAALFMAVALGAAPHAERLGSMLTRVVEVVRQGLGFEPAAPQTRTIRKTERTPSAPVPAPAETAEVETTARQGTTTAALTAMPDRDTLDQAELDARLVLSDASLDVARGIHVSSTPKAVQVEGVIPAPRRRLLARRLNALPYVRVSLRPGPVTDAGALGTPARVTGLSRLVDIRLGDRPEKQTFVPELMRLTVAVTERVHTLNGLAERYSDDRVTELSAAARGKLQKLLDRHYQSLATDLNALDDMLAVLFHSTTRVLPTRRAPDDWQERAQVGVAHADALDRSLRELLGHDDLPLVSPEGEAATEETAMTAAFGALWNVVHANRP